MLLLKNLPEVEYTKLLEDALSLHHVFSYWIAAALYDACHYSMQKAKLLTREHGATPKHRELHRDIHPLTMLGCVRNACASPTLFVVMQDVLAGLTPEQKRHIRVIVRQSETHKPVLPGRPHLSLAEYEEWLHHFPPEATPIGHLFRLTHDEGSTQALLDAYYTALQNASRQIILQPGEMAVFHNRNLYHRAVEHEDAGTADNNMFRYRRVAMYTAGGPL